MKNKSLVSACLRVSLLGLALPGAALGESFDQRREKLLTALTSPAMLGGDIDSGDYSYRRRWQHYHACLAQRVNLDEANKYFAKSDELKADEWPVLLYLRTYFAFKDTVLSQAARQRLAEILLDYKDNARNSKSIERFGTGGNHSIVNFSMYLLSDQEFGNGPKHDIVRQKFIHWARHQGQFGRDEVNSPHYLERSLLPLLNLYDYIKDPRVKLWAQMAIDQMIADFAVLSLDNVRGGPWCRAHHRHSPGVEEINNGTQDSFYVVGYQFFGRSRFPDYPFTDQILSYGFLVTTSYRPPEAIKQIAYAKSQGAYEAKSHRSPVKGSLLTSRQEWDMYYYMTPRYCLAALQDRIELDNHLTSRATKPADYVNTQVWELSFSHPTKILGPKRRLDVSTGGETPVPELDNPNSANMQYKNVLFYQGMLMDYNNNLAADGGRYITEQQGEREYHFWQVPTPGGIVYVGAIHFPEAGAGILEIGTEESNGDFMAFRRAIKQSPSSCVETGLETTYVSTQGDHITYIRRKATVNGKPLPLHDYALYESPYMNSAHGSGLITMGNNRIGELTLDFRDSNKPLRTAGESIPSAVYAAAEHPGNLYFREDWKEIPAAIPVTQDHVKHADLVLSRHGPDADAIKKSHHDEIPNDPWYIWSGWCRKGRWAISLRKKNARVDLSTGGRIRWRTKQSGVHVLKVILQLDDGTWLVSDRGFAETPEWCVSMLDLDDLERMRRGVQWHELDIETIEAGQRVADPDLSRVRSVGWTDLKAGAGTNGCTRVDWIEVYGQTVWPHLRDLGGGSAYRD